MGKVAFNIKDLDKLPKLPEVATIEVFAVLIGCNRRTLMNKVYYNKLVPVSKFPMKPHEYYAEDIVDLLVKWGLNEDLLIGIPPHAGTVPSDRKPDRNFDPLMRY